MAGTKEILATVAFFVNAIIGVIFIGAILVFLWGVLQSTHGDNDTKKRTRAKDVMTRGAVSAAIMAATWGVVTILLKIFDITAQLP